MKKRGYLLEVNRGTRDNRKVWVEELERAGLTVDRLPHLTSVIVRQPEEMTWRSFKAHLKSIMQPRKTASLLLTTDDGRWFVCRNSGNQPGRFVRYR